MTFPFRQHFIYMGVLSQNVKDHFCIVEVVAMDVGSPFLQVSGFGYAPDSGVKFLLKRNAPVPTLPGVGYRQLSTPSVVRMAVRMATMSWMMYLMVSFFIGNR